ncbi:MAG: hypothetical protein AAGJ50_12405, partial [Pseudomonadota bacterium]
MISFLVFFLGGCLGAAIIWQTGFEKLITYVLAPIALCLFVQAAVQGIDTMAIGTGQTTGPISGLGPAFVYGLLAGL